MTALDERIKALEERLKQEKAKKAKLEARKRASIAKAERAADTRRKILVGSYVMESLKRSGKDVGNLSIDSHPFKDWLTRADDRSLFGLAALESPQTAKE
jgi:hypothetical protein